MNALVTAIVTAVFAQLEAKFANRPVILVLIHTLEVVALAAVPLIAADAKVSLAAGAALKSFGHTGSEPKA